MPRAKRVRGWVGHFRLLLPPAFFAAVFISKGQQVQNPTPLIRGPQMGGQIRHCRIWRFWGPPIFSPEVPKYQFLKGLGPLDGKFGRPKTPNSTTTDLTAHLRPSDLNPAPATCNQRKTKVALQFSEVATAEAALQHSLFCSADVVLTKSCAAANEKLHCNMKRAALQQSGAFLPLSSSHV